MPPAPNSPSFLLTLATACDKVLRSWRNFGRFREGELARKLADEAHAAQNPQN